MPRMALAAAAGAAVLAVVLAAVLAAAWPADAPGPAEPAPEPDVIMPARSSRPGCEEDDACYVPSRVGTAAGGTITWRNDDSAFHSVTSGAYGGHDGLYDSGHLGPSETFSYRFAEPGDYAYHCTLHPWMEGTVAVR